MHTRAHLYRAIIEGLVYGLRAGREQIEKRTGRRIRLLRVSGGGSQSDAAMQITADVFGLPAERPDIHETSALGAAMNCAVGLGVHADYATRGARDVPHRIAFRARPGCAQDLRRAVPRGLPAAVSAAAAAVPAHPRDYRLSGLMQMRRWLPRIAHGDIRTVTQPA